jgi:AcrR family transcriptional regulator
MARIIKKEEYDARRSEILAVAQRLVQTRGFAQMSIQDILDELGISKGAFYHYFSSKPDLLEALVERIELEVTPILLPVVHDPALSAIEKLHQIFDLSAAWKAGHKDLMLGLLRVWYDDDNALFRQRVFLSGLRWFSPMLSEVIHQGVREGIFRVAYPDQFGEILFSLFQGLGDSIAHLFLVPEPALEEYRQLESTLGAYNAALERILGAPEGSLRLVEPEMLQDWFLLPETEKP